MMQLNDYLHILLTILGTMVTIGVATLGGAFWIVRRISAVETNLIERIVKVDTMLANHLAHHEGFEKSVERLLDKIVEKVTEK